MSRPRKFKTPLELESAWNKYKTWCNNQTTIKSCFDSSADKFVSGDLLHSVTYTIKGFCVWTKMSRSAFYANYAENKRFADTITRMREECEVDARMKFELGILPAQLAPLWMGKNFGYGKRNQVDIANALSVTV